MIFDSHGLPKDLDATDYADSARLVGLLLLTKHPQAPPADLSFLYYQNHLCLRYPFPDPLGNLSSNNPLNVTRDQILCLAAGWASLKPNPFAIFTTMDLLKQTIERSIWPKRAQNTEADVVGSMKPWWNGADIYSPADINHFRLCAGLKGTLLGYAFLRLEIAVHNHFTPEREPNQLLCKAIIAGPKYVALMRSNSKLIKAIYTYWGVDRGEYELANHIINFIEGDTLNHLFNKN